MKHARSYADTPEFRALMDSPSIEPLYRWCRKFILEHKAISANDVPRTLCADSGWKNAAGQPLENHAIGPALERLVRDGVAYRARRIDAADENASHRRVTLYRLKGAAIAEANMDTPPGKQLVGAALLLCGHRAANWPDPPAGKSVDFAAGWAACRERMYRQIGYEVAADALRQMGADVAAKEAT